MSKVIYLVKTSDATHLLVYCFIQIYLYHSYTYLSCGVSITQGTVSCLTPKEPLSSAFVAKTSCLCGANEMSFANLPLQKTFGVKLIVTTRRRLAGHLFQDR